jgi:hypothetical protein
MLAGARSGLEFSVQHLILKLVLMDRVGIEPKTSSMP